jgi:hypothetical protein
MYLPARIQNWRLHKHPAKNCREEQFQFLSSCTWIKIETSNWPWILAIEEQLHCLSPANDVVEDPETCFDGENKKRENVDDSVANTKERSATTSGFLLAQCHDFHCMSTIQQRCPCPDDSSVNIYNTVLRQCS